MSGHLEHTAFMNEILLSIIVPVFNRAETVGLAIQSIGAHPSRAWEVIVVDDGSSDGSVDVARAALAGLNRPDQDLCKIITKKTGERPQHEILPLSTRVEHIWSAWTAMISGHLTRWRSC